MHTAREFQEITDADTNLKHRRILHVPPVALFFEAPMKTKVGALQHRIRAEEKSFDPCSYLRKLH